LAWAYIFTYVIQLLTPGSL